MTTLQDIEIALSADWQKAVAFFKTAEQDVATFLSKVATGAELLVSDIEAAAQYVVGHLSVINTTVATISAAASTIAPGNATVAKVVSDLQTAASDTASLAQGIVSGSTANSSTAVTDTVAAINSVQTLAGLASQASASLSQLANASPTATQSVSPATPSSP